MQASLSPPARRRDGWSGAAAVIHRISPPSAPEARGNLRLGGRREDVLATQGVSLPNSMRGTLALCGRREIRAHTLAFNAPVELHPAPARSLRRLRDRRHLPGMQALARDDASVSCQAQPRGLGRTDRERGGKISLPLRQEIRRRTVRFQPQAAWLGQESFVSIAGTASQGLAVVP